MKESVQAEAKKEAKKAATQILNAVKKKENQRKAIEFAKKNKGKLKALGAGVGKLGVAGLVVGAVGATLSMAKKREAAYRAADLALERQKEAQRKAGRPMPKSEEVRLRAALRRAYITQAERK